MSAPRRHGHARSRGYFFPFLPFAWARSLAATVLSDFEEDLLDSSLLAFDAAFLPVAIPITSLLRRMYPQRSLADHLMNRARAALS